MNTKTETIQNKVRELITLIHKNSLFIEKLNKLIALQDLGESTLDHSQSLATDEDVAQLRIGFENDSTIIVKAHKKSPIPYDCRQLGFRDQYTKTWRFFTDTLTNHDHTFDFGVAYFFPDGTRKNRIKSKDYDARWKLVHELNCKLLSFFRKEYGWEFPNGYKLYQKSDRGNSERKFKFQIDPPSSEASFIPSATRESVEARYFQLNENDLIQEIKNLTNDHVIVHGEAPDNLVTAFEVGKEKFDWTEGSMKGVLQF